MEEKHYKQKITNCGAFKKCYILLLNSHSPLRKKFFKFFKPVLITIVYNYYSFFKKNAFLLYFFPLSIHMVNAHYKNLNGAEKHK